ncbi:MAG: signal peptidase II [Clostridiales bacterium]|nr:signal peptidase II [Clostridiales bacterium]
MPKKSFKNTAQVCWAFIKRIAKHVWEYLKVAKMEWIVLLAVFAFDLISKTIVEHTVAINTTVVVIPKFFNIHRLHNYAAAFGADFLKSWFGDIGARIFYSVFAVAASVAFVLVLIRQKGKSRWFRVAIALFVAGAMGNCIDRMYLGYVRDFIEFEYFGLTIFGKTTWYVFNIADAALVVGVIMMIIYFLFMMRDKDKEVKHAEVQSVETPAASEENPDSNATNETDNAEPHEETKETENTEDTETAVETAATVTDESDASGENTTTDDKDGGEPTA